MAQCAARTGRDLRGRISKIGVEVSDRQGSKAGQSLWVRFPD